MSMPRKHVMLFQMTEQNIDNGIWKYRSKINHNVCCEMTYNFHGRRTFPLYSEYTENKIQKSIDLKFGKWNEDRRRREQSSI